MAKHEKAVQVGIEMQVTDIEKTLGTVPGFQAVGLFTISEH